jgi:hypothetical protein
VTTGDDLEAQVAHWRDYLGQRDVAAGEIADRERRLREQVVGLVTAGLSDAEAFLIAVGRWGRTDTTTGEYIRENADRLWEPFVPEPGAHRPDAPETAARPWRELAVVLAIAACSAIAVKIALAVLPATRFALTASLTVAPFLAGYFAWKRHLAARQIVGIAVVLVLLAVVLGSYPFADTGDTTLLAAIHVPVIAWLLVGVAYVGPSWRSDARRMDFIRFTGEFLVYYVLLALGGGALIGLTVGSFAAVGVDVTGFVAGWVLPVAIPGAVLVAAYLVDARQDVLGRIAPVLTWVFIPLTIVLVVALLAAYAVSGGAGHHDDRTLLIMMDLVLILVLGLVVYAISARRPAAPIGVLDHLRLVLVVAALLADALMLATMLSRIAQFGWSPNKVAALGLNVVLLVNLARSAQLDLRLVRGRSRADSLGAWQTRYLPVFGAWAMGVMAVLPPAFAFA